FRWCTVRLADENSTSVNAALGEIPDQFIAFHVITNNAYRHRICAEGPQIMNGIGAPAGDELRLTMVKNQNRRFSRDSRNLSVNKNVGDKVTANDNPLALESMNEFVKPPHPTFPDRIDSTASIRFSATKCG